MVEFVFMFVIMFFSKRRHDLELPNIECLWVEISIKNKMHLKGTFYRPPNSTNAILSSIEDSIGLAFDTNISNILITGDFNLDILKDNSSQKVRDLCQQFNFEQIINEPTHFTENSSSLIDLILTSNRNTILLSGVGEPFLEQNIRYHCPVFCVLTFSKPLAPLYKRRVFIYDRGNYQAFSNDLVQTDWQTLKSENINTYAENITKRITTLTNKHVPNRLINARKTDPAWLTTHIKKLIRKKKRLYDKYKKSNNINNFETYKQFKNLVTREIRKSKKEVLNKLTENLVSPNTKQNGWWKTLKHCIKPDQTDVIPPLNKNGQIYTEEKEKANILNNFFTKQTLR